MIIKACRLSPATMRSLHQALGDAASGTPLQWWHLEIAARLPDAPPAGPAAQGLAWMIRHLGADRCIPLLRALGLNGLLPYRRRIDLPIDRDATQAATAALCLLAFCVGIGGLNASRQLALVLLALGGAVATGWRAVAATRQALVQMAAAQRAVSATLPDAESVLGLAGLLTATGIPFGDAAAIAKRIATAPDAIDDRMVETLGLWRPSHRLASVALRHAMAWSSGTVAVAWPCWLVADWRQLVVATLGSTLVTYVCHGTGGQARRATGFSLAAALAFLTFGWVL